MNPVPPSLPGALLVDDQNPWPGLVSFTEEASAYFRGRNDEKAELFRLVVRETLSVVFGQSGLGKTSLLLAGLFPELRRSGYLPVYVRLSHGPDQPALADQLLAAVADAAVRAGATPRPARPGESLWAYFQRRGAAVADAAGQPLIPVIVIDQFEEIFTLGRRQPEQAAALVAELECLVENRAPAAAQARFEQVPEELEDFDFDRRAFKLVLSLREDYLPELEAFRNRLRGLAQNRFRLQRMNGRQALAVALEAGFGLIDEAAARLVVDNLGSDGAEGDLARRVVEPALLSVVLRELNFRRQREGAATITPAMITVAQDILRDFYLEKMADVPAEFRPVIEDAVLSDSGRYRVQVAMDDLAASGVAADLVERLVQRRILRYDERYGARVVELTHDRLVPVVQACRLQRQEDAKTRAAEEARQAAEQQARESAQREAKMKRQLRRSRMVTAAFAVLAVLAGVTTFWALRAQQAEKSAQSHAAQMQQSAERGLALAYEEMGIPLAQVTFQLESLDDSRAAREGAEDGSTAWRTQDVAYLAKAAATLYLYGDLHAGLRYAAELEEALQRAEVLKGLTEPERAVRRAQLGYLLGAGQLRLGRLAEAEKNLQASLALLPKPGATLSPELTELAEPLPAMAWADLAELAKVKLDYPAAKERMERALAAAQAVRSGQTELLRAAALTRLGGWQIDNDFKAASASFRQAGEVLLALVSRESGNLRYQAALAEVFLGQARVAWNEGRLGEASSLLERVSEICGRLGAADDANPAWTLLGLKRDYLRYQIEMRGHDERRAMESLVGVEPVSLSLLRLQPNWYEAGLLRAQVLAKLAALPDLRYNTEWLNQNRERDHYLGLAQRRYEESLALLKDLVGLVGEVSEAGVARAEIELAYGGFKVERGEAGPHGAEPVAAIAALVAARPESVVVRALDCDTRYLRADAAMKEKNHALAASEFARVRELSVPLFAVQPTSGRHRTFLSATYHLAEALDQTGATAEARRTREQGVADALGFLRQNPTESLTVESLAWLQLRLSQLELERREWAEAVGGMEEACATVRAGLQREPADNRLARRLDETLLPEVRRYREVLLKEASVPQALVERLDTILQPPRRYSLAPIVPGTWQELSPAERDLWVGRIAQWLKEIGAADKSRLETYAPQLTRLAPWARDGGADSPTTGAAESARTEKIGLMRLLKLPFYPDAVLIEAEVERAGAPAGLLTLVLSGFGADTATNAGPAGPTGSEAVRPIVLHHLGVSSPIHAMNAETGLLLETQKQAEDYLRYFCMVINGEGGPFRIVDSPDEIEFLPEAGPEPARPWAAKVQPLRLEKGAGGTWRGTATVLYADAVFVSNFEIQPTGMVTMTDDNPLAADLPVRRDAFRDGLRAAQDLAFKYRLKTLLDGTAWDWKTAADLLRARLAQGETKELYEQLALVQLYQKNYAGALVSTELGLELTRKSDDASNRLLWVRRANALLFLGRTEEAKAIYLDPRQVAFATDKIKSESWADIVTREFDLLKQKEKRVRLGSEIPWIIQAVNQAVKAAEAAQAEAKKLAEEKEKADRAAEARYQQEFDRLVGQFRDHWAKQQWPEAVQARQALVDYVRQHRKGHKDYDKTLAFELANLGWARTLARDFAGALEAADESIKLYPYWFWAKTVRGNALVLLGRVDEAEKAYFDHWGTKVTQEAKDEWDAQSLTYLEFLQRNDLAPPALEGIMARLRPGADRHKQATEAKRRTEEEAGARLKTQLRQLNSRTSSRFAEQKWSEAVAAQKVAVDFVRNNYKSRKDHDEVLAFQLAELAWYQIAERDFAGALESADAGLKLHRLWLTLDTYRAHALLFLGRVEEAEQAYFSHWKKSLAAGGQNRWDKETLRQITALEELGLTQEAWARIKEKLKPGAEAARQAEEEKERAERETKERLEAGLKELTDKANALRAEKRRAEAVAAREAAVDFVRKHYEGQKYRDEILARELGDLALDRQLARDFTGALAAVEEALKLYPYWLMLDSTRATSLLFLDRTAEAEEAYVSHWTKDIEQARRDALNTRIIERIALFENNGITHPGFARIKEKLKPGADADRARKAAEARAQESKRGERLTKVRAVMEEQTKLFLAGKWTEAVEAARAALRVVQDDWPAGQERDRLIGRAQGTLSWYSLFTRQFAEALAAADASLLELPGAKGIEANRVHALLFLGRYADAERYHLEVRSAIERDLDRDRWDQRVADDIAELIQAGLTHPDLGRFQELLRPGAEAARAREQAVTARLATWAAEQKSLREGKKWAALAALQQEVVDYLIANLPTGAERQERLKGHYLNLSWSRLLARDFDGALHATVAGLKLDQSYLPLETNRAHALLFLGRTAEAEKLYLAYRGRKLEDQDDRLWEEIIAEDFDALAKEGLAHPEFARLRGLLQASAQGS